MAGQNWAKLLQMVTHALKIAPWNERVNKSNFEKSGFKSKPELQEPLGRMIYHWRACIESFIALPNIHAEI